MAWRTFGIAAAIVSLAFAAMVLATGITGDRVLGQFDFTHSTPNLVDAMGLSNPVSVAIDTSATPNRIYVADSDNDRILGWKDADAFANGAPADLVIGQPDFLSSVCTPTIAGSICICNVTSADNLCNPSGVATDHAGNLYVSDSLRNRVLGYSSPFEACSTFPCVGGPASLVLGQGGSFTSFECNFDTGTNLSTAADLCGPTGLAVDNLDNLYVADSDNDRVLKYDKPLTSETVAGMVFGQNGSFTTSDCNTDTGGGSPTASDLCVPTGIALDGLGNLFIADSINNRVLEYNAPPTTTANQVYGQGGSFTSGDCDGDTFDTGSSADDLCNPTDVIIDAAGNLYVADSNNGRVLEYNPPLTTNTTADLVLGQGGDFTSNNCNSDVGVLNDTDESTSNDLCTPIGVAIDGSGNLFVADAGNSGNNRVLKYNTPLAADTTAEGVLGQLDFTHQNSNLTDSRGLSNPASVAIDFSSTPNRIYVTDLDNNRVLGWRDAATFADGAAADLVIGQPDFLSYTCDGVDGVAVNASRLCTPNGVAVDGLGNLYVADTGNNRVLEYPNPFAACSGTFPCVAGPATLVIGQGASFTSRTQNNGGITASSLAGPVGVAADVSGNLYVVDKMNNRVLEYSEPVTSGASAALVFGQNGSFSSNGCNSDTGGSFKPSSAIDLCAPVAATLDGMGNLYVADSTNSRVLEYNTPLNPGSGEPGAGDVTADLVFGQGGSFTSNKCNLGGRSASSICGPMGIAVDNGGNLYIADGFNDRVLEYNTPLTTDTIADRVFGTCGSFTSFACTGVSADSLKNPMGLAVDNPGNLYVVDNQNNRVLEYNLPLAIATPTATSTPTATASSTSTPTATPSATPTSTASPGPGHIQVNRKAISLAAAPNATASASITITNTGIGTLTVNVSSPRHNPPLSEMGGGNGISIAAGMMHNVVVVYSPTKKGTTSDLISITSNDPSHKKVIKIKVKAKSK